MYFTMNYVSFRRALRYGFLFPIKGTSGYKLGWLLGKLYFSGGTMTTEFDRDLNIASRPIEPIMVVVVSKNKILWCCSLYLR
jgi:hypothetical protein